MSGDASTILARFGLREPIPSGTASDLPPPVAKRVGVSCVLAQLACERRPGPASH